jgi:hypothetical protein
MENFPIGSRVHYYPEMRKEMRVESLILGYAINRRSVYSAGAIRIGEDGVAVIDEAGERVTLGAIDDFYFLIPFQERSEVDLADNWWERPPEDAASTQINDFVSGNIITLFSRRGPQGMPKLETVVKRTLILRTGIYANTRVAMLRPEPEHFGYIDRRKDLRVATRVPTLVKTSRDGPTVRALIDEFSEGHVCILPQAGDEVLTKLEPGQKVVFVVENAEQERRHVLRGSLMRHRQGRLVLRLEGILKRERFHALEQIDLLEIKAALLNYPQNPRPEAEPES